MDTILTPHEWALGIPLGWNPLSNEPHGTTLTGSVLYQDRILTLDPLSYLLWSDAVRGQVAFEQCGTAPYLPPTLAREKRNTGRTASPEHIGGAAHRLVDLGLVWHFDPSETIGYHQLAQFEIAVQGVPVGNIDHPDRYRIHHNDGSPALDTDAISYLLWLQWWTNPHVLGAAQYVGHQLAIPLKDVMGHAAATLLHGMSVGLLYISGVHHA